MKCASPMKAGMSATASSTISHGAYTKSPAAKLAIVTTSCACAEELAHEPGAPRGLHARALETVLELAVLEVLEVERAPRAPSGARWSWC